METDPEESTSAFRSRRVLSQSEPALLRQVKSQQSQRGRSAARLVSGLRVGSLLRTWENVSKINYLSMARAEPSDSVSTETTLRRRSIGMPPKDMSLSQFVPNTMRNKSDEDLFAEQFPIVVTPLLNEEQLWGCFYTFPELYEDVYSPVVRVRRAQDVPELVGGVLTRDMVTACLTYLKRTPILGDFVYIKLDLSYKYLMNIEVLQHYKYLVYLDLSYNYLTELSVLSHLLYLQHLNVAFNRLGTVLEYETPQWFLTEVRYKYNSVKKIRDLTLFWSITILDLSHNNIKVISGLENLHYLRRLDLSFNHIQRLENLNHLRLVWLDLSYNNISSFEFSIEGGLWTLYHLEYLNLNENNLTSMKIFSGCTRIQELHARNNRLGVLLELAVYMRQMRRLVILDLRANPVCSIPGYKVVAVSTFPILLRLDAEELDPVEQRTLKMDMSPDVNAFAIRRLLRLMYIEQLSKARVSPFVPPGDTTEVPMVIIVGGEAVGKGTLVRRLATECSSNIEVAIQHTTATCHPSGYYIQVSREKFDAMLLAGEFLTYTEKEGESYGLSREQAFIKDGKVKVACMDLISALIMKNRGRRPYLILATCLDKISLTQRQSERKTTRNKFNEFQNYPGQPSEKSTLQVLVSGRILVTGILNEIIMYLPEEKDASEFVVESQCSLFMDSDTRKAIQDYARGVNLYSLLSSGTSLLDEVNAYKSDPNEASLCSLFKESQNTDEYTSQINGGGRSSVQESPKKPTDNRQDGKPDRLSETSRPKSVDFSRYVSSTWKGGSFAQGAIHSVKSSKSVTFTAQDEAAAAAAAAGPKQSLPRELTVTGMIVEPQKQEESGVTQQGPALPRSLSTKFPHTAHPSGGRPSGSSLDDADLWLMFLIETGLLASESGEKLSADPVQRHDTRVDDPEYIMKQLAHYRAIEGPTFTTNIRDEYDEIHRKCPGLFWDTITMDDPDPAFKKAKKIIRDIVGAQKHLKPMFDIDFYTMADDYPTIKTKVAFIANHIAPLRFFY